MSFINFRFILNGQTINIQAKTDEMFAEVAFRYLGKAGLDINANNPKFLFNTQELKLDNPKTLAELNMPKIANIDVVLMNNSPPPPITIGMKKENKTIFIQTRLDDVFADIVKRYILHTLQKEKKFHFFLILQN